MARFRMLSIDGGGIRGLIPALILEELERRLARPLHSVFDVIAGTSTGGIISLGLTTARRRPRASELVRLYREEGTRIFPRTGFDRALHRVRELLPFFDAAKGLVNLPSDVEPRDLFDPKYAPEGRAAAVRAYFGDEQVRDARTRVWITSYDTDARTPVFFTTRDEDREEGGYHVITNAVSMFDAAMATSAAPTYFPPHQVKKQDEAASFSLIDGGVFANNPTGHAHAFLRKSTDYTGDLIVSLGTGAMERRYPFEQIAGWGALQWGVPALKMMLDGQTEAVALVMQRRLAKGSYYRIQEPLEDVSDDLDDVSPENIARMETLAKRIILMRDGELDQICEALTEP